MGVAKWKEDIERILRHVGRRVCAFKSSATESVQSKVLQSATIPDMVEFAEIHERTYVQANSIDPAVGWG